MKKLKSYLAAGSCLAILLPGCQKTDTATTATSIDRPSTQSPAQTSSTSPSEIRHVTLAANVPLSGNLSTYGTSIRDGANMAVEELTTRPDAAKIDIDWQDNAGNARSTLMNAQKQLLSKPDIYVTGVKPQFMAIKDVIEKEGIPHFVWVFDAKINSSPAGNNLRTYVGYNIEPAQYLKYARSRKAKRIAIVFVSLPHTEEEFKTILIPALNKDGVKDILVEPYDIGLMNFSSLAVKVKDFKPDLIILNGFQDGLVGLVRAMRPLDLIKDGNTIGTYDMLDAARLLAPEEIEGIRAIVPGFVSSSNATTKEFVERFEKRYRRKPLYTDAYAYDMISIVDDAAKRLTLPASHDSWLKALRAVRREGVTGVLQFDEDGSLMTPLFVAVYRGGKPQVDGAVK